MSDADSLKREVAFVTSEVSDLKRVVADFQSETAKTMYNQLDILTSTAERLEGLRRDLLGDDSHKGRCAEHTEEIDNLRVLVNTQREKEIAREAQLKLLKMIMGLFSVPWILEAFKFFVTYIKNGGPPRIG